MSKKTCIYFIISLFSVGASAQVKTYDLSWKKDGLITGIGISLNVLGISLLNHADHPDATEIATLRREDVWSFDRGATFNNSKTAGKWSDIILYSASTIPFLTYFDKTCRNEGGSIALMAVETWLITNGITDIVKASTKRYRPLVYNDQFSLEEKLANGSRRSFFSGHTSSTTALSFFTAKVILDTHPDMKNKWIVWSLGAAIPAAIGYLRYEAGKHYPTDIITGYAVGATIGYLIPHIHKSDRLSINTIGSNGLSLTYILK
ncbi:MAG: phosphatase PAP2 family protein [Saprospiraceae bacterium]